jgi:hypothetical protein
LPEVVDDAQEGKKFSLYRGDCSGSRLLAQAIHRQPDADAEPFDGARQFADFIAAPGLRDLDVEVTGAQFVDNWSG